MLRTYRERAQSHHSIRIADYLRLIVAPIWRVAARGLSNMCDLAEPRSHDPGIGRSSGISLFLLVVSVTVK